MTTTDVAANNGTAPATGGGPAGSDTDETNLALILHEMSLLERCLDRVGDISTLLLQVAGATDEAISRVDEESTRVEAPSITRAATDAANVVGKLITQMVVEVSRNTRTAHSLVLTARRGMRTPRNVQADMRAIGAGPKLLASANKR